MKVIHNLRMDLARCGCRPVVAAVQGEANTRVLAVSLYDNGVAWEIPEAAVVEVAFQKPDGTKGLYSKLPDDSPATTFSGNVLSATMAPQMLTCAGTIRAAFVFHDEGTKVLATFPFQITVEANPAVDAVKSEDYHNPTVADMAAAVAAAEAAQAAAEAARLAAESAAPADHAHTAAEVGARPDSWMPTAAQVGARPDTWMPTAAEVGARPDTWMPTAAEVGAAPAELVDGFYTVADGTDEAFLEVINTVYASMPNRSVRYIVVAFSKAHPIVGGSTYIIKISRVYAEYGTLEMSSYSGLAFYRTRSDNSWQPLECVNPNLSLGKEYRTTERSNGKVVYAQAVDFGAMPDTSYKERYLNDGITGLVRVEGECKYHDGTDSAPFATVSFIGEITIIGGNTLKVTTTQNASSWVGYPVVYYVKS